MKMVHTATRVAVTPLEVTGGDNSGGCCAIAAAKAGDVRAPKHEDHLAKGFG